jgi:CRP-like cAMP-binding protein
MECAGCQILSTHEEFIRGVTLLSGLNEYERLTIADALVAMHYGPGETIIREGEGGQDFFFIEEGEVKATKAGVEGEVSRRLRSGDYFGEIALINNSVRHLTSCLFVCFIAEMCVLLVFVTATSCYHHRSGANHSVET